MHNAVLVGGNLAVLVAALELARAGERVVLAADGRAIGGHFRGLRVDGFDFDLGRVMIERADPAVLSSSAPRPDHDESWTAWGVDVDAVLLEHLPGLHRAPTPESHVLGRRWPDHVTANRLDVIADPRLPEAPATDAHDDLHARRKLLSGAYDGADYATAAAANHGALHELLFEPFVRKVMGVPSSAFLARHHRYAWTPLYWPESLRAARVAAPGTQAQVLPEYPFFAPASGFTGELVQSLERALRREGRVTFIEGSVDHLVVGGGECSVSVAGRTWSGRHVVLGVAPARAATMLGVPAPADRRGNAVALVLARVRASAIADPTSCLYLCDPADPVYRITDQEILGGGDAEWHRVVVEGVGGASRADLIDCARRHLGVEDPGAFQVLHSMTVPDAKPVPTAALLQAMAEDSSRLLEAAPGVVLTGSLLHHGAAALSEQLARGKAVASALRG